MAHYGTLTIVWGVSFVVLARIEQAFGWVGAVAFRALIARAVAMGVSLATKRRLHFTTGRWPFVVVGATTIAGQFRWMTALV